MIPALGPIVEHLQPRMAKILARYRIPVDDAEEILEDLFFSLALKRDTITRPDRWILASLKERCIHFWRERREQFCRTLDSGLLGILDSTEIPEDEKEEVRARAVAIAQRLSTTCRRKIFARYGLEGEARPGARRRRRTARLDEPTTRCLIAFFRLMMGVDAPPGEPDA